MKKIILVVILSVGLFGNGYKCNLFLDKALENAKLFNLAVDSGDILGMDNYSAATIKYIEHTIVYCNGVMDEEAIIGFKQDMADYIQMRKDLKLK